MPRHNFYLPFVKPLGDTILAIVAAVVLLPLFLLIAALLFVVNRGKVLFRQQRVGFRERLFVALKFRTMNDAMDSAGNLLPDEFRLTSVGKFIRRTSLDEIPQIINVLKGDMSFIGPRPLLPEYIPYYDEVQKKRHLVRPGITGLAQVNGRNLTTWEKRLEMDAWYVENVSFSLDIKIFFRTIVKVIRSEGITPEGGAAMPKFSDYVKAKSIR